MSTLDRLVVLEGQGWTVHGRLGGWPAGDSFFYAWMFWPWGWLFTLPTFGKPAANQDRFW